MSLAAFALAAQIAAQAADTGTTLYALSNRMGTEANPLLPQSPVKILVVKSALAGVSAWSTVYLRRKGHPRLALASSFAITGLGAFAAIHNARVIHTR